MPVKKESSMGLKEHKGYVRRKKLKKEELGETMLALHAGQAAERFGPEKRNGKFSAGEDEFPGRLLQLEQDVAEALADFWRIAQLQTQQSSQADFVAGLQWSGKRRRSSRADKNVINPSGSIEEPEDALSSAKRSKPACVLERASSASDRDESVGMVLEVGKESPVSESRAESPSSPLPALQQSCRDFLAGGKPVAKSAFLRVVPLRPLPEPCLIQVKAELEEMNTASLIGRPGKIPAKRKLPPKSMTTVKRELPHEQVEYAHDLKVARSAGYMPVDPVSDSFAISTSKLLEIDQDGGLVAMKKSKSALSEEEKEARRQRRVQANRESARQTIRRKQVLCEELTRKAASLTLENKGMKQKKDLLLQELISLKGQNHHLRQQLVSSCPETLGPDQSQQTSFPFAGIPVQSFVWALPIAQAGTSVNQGTMPNYKDYVGPTLGNPAQGSTAQVQGGGVVVPGAVPATNRLNSTEQSESPFCQGALPTASSGLPKLEAGSIEGVSGESGTHQNTPLTDLDTSKACNAVSCRPSAGLSDIETVPSKGGSGESVTSQSERVHYTTMTNDQPDPADVKAVHPPVREFSTDARSSWSHPTAFTQLAGKSCFDVANGMGLRSEGIECSRGAQMPLALGCGYPFGGSRAGAGTTTSMKGQSLYMGRNCVAAMVAAEARRRRKELTRSKFSRARAVRPPSRRR